MFKKAIMVLVAAASLSLITSVFAEVEVKLGEGDHWWHHPDRYHGDFEKWYPEHKEEWGTYYKTHKDHFTKYCESHKGWTFCE